jgi:riboflavin synthase
VVALFTGLVQAKGELSRVDRDGDGARIAVASGLGSEIADGDSVSVNGVCLTATATTADGFEADVMEETLRRSSLGPLEPGSEVNLELALRAADRLGGHMVQGHVDGTGEVESVTADGFSRIIRIAVPDDLLRYVVAKGSIAIDGVSLTIAAEGEGWFTVALIPETLERTTLGTLEPGRRVNVEVDVLAKYVEKLVSRTVEAP